MKNHILPMLQRGDILLTENPMALGRAINVAQKIVNKDSKSKYTHAGLIVNPVGTTYEALWRVRECNLFTQYAGKHILIARHSCMNQRTFQKAYDFIKRENGNDFYPFYRLFFHLAPPLAKLSVGRVVCSELVAKALWKVELFPYYNGCNPDDLYDHICWGERGGEWEIIYEDVLAQYLLN